MTLRKRIREADDLNQCNMDEFKYERSRYRFILRLAVEVMAVRRLRREIERKTFVRVSNTGWQG